MHIRTHSLTHTHTRYFLRVVITRRLSDIVKELDVAVHTLSHFPEMNNSLKMEVGIEDCLHIEFEYNKAKWVADKAALHQAVPSHKLKRRGRAWYFFFMRVQG